jgi:hypothetical protein
MPNLVSIFRQLDPLEFVNSLKIKQAQLDLGGMSREQREVHAQTIPCRSQRKWPTLLNPLPLP